MGEIWRGFSRGVEISDLLFKGPLVWLTLKTVSEFPFQGIIGQRVEDLSVICSGVSTRKEDREDIEKMY